MIGRSGRQRQGRRPFGPTWTASATFTACVALAALLTACSSSTSTTAALSGPQRSAVSIPLTTSIAARSATLAVVAMGHLDQPLNTFWQLFTLVGSTPRWELATPPGVASNGGLVAAVGSPATVIAGFEPSLDLHFSPLARTGDLGATWSAGVLPGGLAAVPDSLATSGRRYLALLRTVGGEVVANDGDLATWTRVTTEASLTADASTSACRITGLTAVAFGANGTDTLGVQCGRGATAGILESVDGRWQPVGPKLPVSTAGPTEVIRLVATTAGISALVSTGSAGSRELFALWSGDGMRTWAVSSALAVGSGGLVSTGITAAGGLIVLTGGSGAVPAASVADPSARRWQHLAAPPAGTAAVVAGPGDTYDALGVDQATLHVDSLGNGGWHRVQTVKIPIEYGSSG